MIPKYIKNWLTIIEQMNNDNTYKLAWGRAIVECISFDDFSIDKNQYSISFYSIAKRMLKYYWNQTFFFNLKQSPYLNKNPYICTYTNELIEVYKVKSKSSIPLWYDDAEEWFIKNSNADLENTIKKIKTILPQNVAWRFMKTPDGDLPVYILDKKKELISFTEEQIDAIKEYSIIISKLLSYKWSQLLEQYNCSPKIASKVNGISEAKLRRHSLASFKNELLKEFKGKTLVDFYTGKPLEKDDISIDHVIPWSFMYSDNIWNLVITSKSNNSSKSNSIPSQEVINKLNARNLELVNILSGKLKLELEEAIKNKYVDKFYFQCRI